MSSYVSKLNKIHTFSSNQVLYKLIYNYLSLRLVMLMEMIAMCLGLEIITLYRFKI